MLSKIFLRQMNKSRCKRAWGKEKLFLSRQVFYRRERIRKKERERISKPFEERKIRRKYTACFLVKEYYLNYFLFIT